MNALVQYEQMRVAVQACASIDEAADMRDKAAALAAYARQRDDPEIDVWMSEIRLRATIRIGELVRELETAEREGPRGEYRLPSDGKSKADAIIDAGLSTSTAHRYEELAGGRDERGMAAAQAAAEAHFAKARAEQKPATMEGLRGAIKEAITATLGPPPVRARREAPPCPPPDHTFIDFYACIRPLGEPNCPFRAEVLAAASDAVLAGHYLTLARRSAALLARFIAEMERRFPNASDERTAA